MSETVEADDDFEALRAVQERKRLELGIPATTKAPPSLEAIVSRAGRVWERPNAAAIEARARDASEAEAKRAAERAALAEARRQRAIDRALESVDEAFRWATVGSLGARPRTVNAAKLGCENLDRGAVLVTLAGPSGVGKTTVAAALYRRAVEAMDAPDGEWIAASEIVHRARLAAMRREPFELLERCLEAGVLVLDDLGQEPGGEWKRDIIHLIQRRHARRQITIVTTFLAAPRHGEPCDAVDRYGDGVARRLFEDESLIRFRGDS
ncbi:MAG: ATP-binding protein [Polyangiaceae bacterium]|nr:ATP-binding protein [Polyangiaceae bacterium]